MTSTEEPAAGDATLRLSFKTKHEDYVLPPSIANNVFDLPRRLNRLGLSEVVNHLLDTSDKPVPFEFLVGDIPLRTSLRKHLKTHELSSVRLLSHEQSAFSLVQF